MRQRLISGGGDPRAVFRKAAQVIMARPRGDIDLVDMKMFNYLLQRSYRNLRERPVHQVPVQDVLEYLRHTSTSRVHESLRRLGKVNIEIDYVDEDGRPHSVLAHFLSYDMSRTEDGIIHFAFDPILMRFQSEPKVFAWLNGNLNRNWRSAYAAKIYEIMALYEKRFSPVWEVSPEALRETLGIPEGQHDRFDNLRRKVIERAVAEVNEVAEFDVEVDYARGGRGGKVVQIRFRAVPKASPALIDPPNISDAIGRGPRTRRDPNTPDVFDGLTDVERGGPPMLSPETLREAAEMIGAGGDTAPYEDEWREEMKGRRVRDPNLSFLRWLQIRLERERDALLVDLESDTFGSLLEQLE